MTMMASQTINHSFVYVTAPDEEVAKNLSKDVVMKKLAACVSIVPKITSVYEWENKIKEDIEVLMIIKTTTASIPKLTEYIKSHHPYKVAEIISTAIQGGNEEYLDWVSSVVNSNL